MVSTQTDGTYHIECRIMGSLCNPVIAGSAVLLRMAENSGEMCVFDYFLCTRRRKKGGKLSNETELKLWSFIMCGFIF